MTDLSSLGEFGLIERIVARLGEAAARDILVPSGDDAAAWANRGAVTVATTDALVEGVHWRTGLQGARPTMSWADAGWRAIASNVSDIAAMGAIPDFALVSAVLGTGLDLEALDCLIEGMGAACVAHGVRIAGGDIDRGSQTVLGVTLIGHARGTVEAPALLRRDGARVGDAIAVSGYPGASAAGLAVIEAGRESEAGVEPLLEAHRRPRARVELGHAALEAGVRCAIDVSDGLLQDLGHIARRSGVGIEVDLDALPISMDAVGALGVGRARDLALGGGEDYELALAGAEAALHSLWRDELPVTVIGRVVAEHPGEAWALDGRGARYVPPSSGWDHLAGGARG